MQDVNVTTIYISRKNWLKELPEIIKTLHKDYHFYYSGTYSNISPNKKIQDLVKEKYKKNLHKICLYQRNHQDWYLVVYRKNRPIIYWCDEYAEQLYGGETIINYDENGEVETIIKPCSRKSQWSAVKRFINKFAKYYNSVEKED